MLTSLSNDLDNINDAVDSIITTIIGDNIFDEEFPQSGYLDTDGSEIAGSNYIRTDFLPIDNENTTLYFIRTAQPYVLGLVFYDATKTAILSSDTSARTQVFNGSTTNLTNTKTIPSNAYYYRLYTSVSAYSGNLCLSYTEQQSYSPHAENIELKDNIVTENTLAVELKTKIAGSADVLRIKSDLLTEKSVNIFNGEFSISGYFDANGEDASSSSWKRTDYIPINAENSTLYFLRTAQLYNLSYCFYDSAKTGVGIRGSIFSASATELKTNISIPSNAVYIRMYTSVSAYNGNLMLSYTENDAYIPHGDMFFLKDATVYESNLDDALKAKVNSGLKLTGKTIAFMGDSIIGNFYDATGVCAHLIEETGANVINCAFGGTRIAYRYSKWGDSTPTATGYVEGATDAQKNQVDQYRYWNTLCGASLADSIATDTWTLQDNAVANMASGLSYFAERLSQIKAIDWSTIDFIMWEYGTNDFMTDVALEGNDLFAYDYALRHTIETILTVYPNVRIITVTPFYRWYQSDGVYTDDSNTHTANDYADTAHKLTDFVEMTQIVSKQYQVPCIDNYYTVGANRFTRLAFFDSADGTHPNEQGRKRIAEHIASQLMSLI